MDTIAIILCGGVGTRLWPLSTSSKPKQFLSLINDNTLLQNTIERIPQNYIKLFISNKNFSNEINKYVTSNDIVIYEPENKNTGQAICVAILYLKIKYNNNFKIVIFPSDHIFDNKTLNTSINFAMNIVNDNNIITFGIKPIYPESGYGYIKKDLNNNIKYFIEKPSLEIANELIKDGCLWNSGIFVFQLDYIHQLFKKFNDDYELCEKSIKNANIYNNVIYIDNIYTNVKSISFDYLIMEKIKTGIVIEYDGIWSDIGDWKSLHNIFCIENQNKIIGNNIKLIESSNSLVYSDTGKILLIGINDTIVVNSNGNLLIMNKEMNNIFKNNINKI